MGSYENFLLRMNVSGSTFREEQIFNAKNLLAETFSNDPSYIPDGVTVWGTERLIHPRINEEKYRSTSPAQAKIQTLITEPIYMGDIIPWPEHGYWLCIDANNLHGIQWQGTLSFCNYIIRFLSFYDRDTILQYPVSILNTTQYGSGETNRYDGDLHVTVGTTQMKVYIPYDKETSMIDNGFRFLVDRHATTPTAYKVTQSDMVSFSDSGDRGYIALTIYEDQFNPDTDNKEFLIADYWQDPVKDHIDVFEDPDKWI